MSVDTVAFVCGPRRESKRRQPQSNRLSSHPHQQADWSTKSRQLLQRDVVRETLPARARVVPAAITVGCPEQITFIARTGLTITKLAKNQRNACVFVCCLLCVCVRVRACVCVCVCWRGLAGHGRRREERKRWKQYRKKHQKKGHQGRNEESAHMVKMT